MHLVDVVRDGFVESRHRGKLVLLDPDGTVEVSAGPIGTPVFPRSSLKPLQAIVLLDSGFAGRGASLALAAASHDGEDVHLAAVRATLAAAGLDESALQCPPELPARQAALIAWVRGGWQPAAVCHNCSGKHAAMVATCVTAHWPVHTYRSTQHPLQQAIRAGLESLCGEEIYGVAVDGCGAPAFAVSLHGLARAFATLATADGPSRLVADAMRGFPRLIGGTGRAVSELTAAVPGLVCKEGAEGVWAAALPDGRSFAAKLEDGSARALPALLATVLQYWDVDGSDAEVLERWAALDVLGGGQRVGAIACAPELRALLAR